MGYTHGRKWEDGDIEKDLLKIIDTLKKPEIGFAPII